MIPAPIIAALAPVLVDALAKPKGRAKAEPAPAPELPLAAESAVGGVVREYFDHEKGKSRVRPTVMRATLFSAVAVKAAVVAAAFAPMVSEVGHARAVGPRRGVPALRPRRAGGLPRLRAHDPHGREGEGRGLGMDPNDRAAFLFLAALWVAFLLGMRHVLG